MILAVQNYLKTFKKLELRVTGETEDTKDIAESEDSEEIQETLEEEE